jgi:hypothetical protein
MTEPNAHDPFGAAELRARIQRIDPVPPSVPTSSPSRERLEDIMASTQEHHSTRSRRLAVAVTAAAVVVVAAIVIPGLGSTPTTTTVAAAPLELSLGDGPGLASCIRFDVETLKPMSVAFEGTVAAVDGEKVTLTVDHWYKGGTAAEVVLSAPAGMKGLTGGIDFVEGDQYLITAEAGTVNYCGFSGPATQDMRDAFHQAFES